MIDVWTNAPSISSKYSVEEASGTFARVEGFGAVRHGQNWKGGDCVA